MGGKIIPRIRMTSAKDLVEVEAELGNRLGVLIVFYSGENKIVVKREDRVKLGKVCYLV